MADPDAQEERFHFSRRAFCAPCHLPAPWGLPVGPNGSKNWSSCLAHNLLTYCVHNKWVLTITSWSCFCQNHILNPLKTWWNLLRCFSGIQSCLSVCLSLCMCLERGRERNMERNSGKWISYSLLITGKHIFYFNNVRGAYPTFVWKGKMLSFISNPDCKVKGSLNLQKNNIYKSKCH